MLGISIKNGRVRYAQADIEDRSFILNQLDDLPLPSGLESPDLRSSDLAIQFQDLFEHITESLSVSDREVFLSLGSEWVECQLMGVDSGLSLDEKEAYMNWILRERQGVLWEDTAAFYQDIGDAQRTPGWVVACVTSKDVIECIRSAIDRVGAVPVWMEPGVLSALRVMVDADDGVTSKTMALEPAGKGFRAQFLSRGRLRAIGKIGLRSGQFGEKITQGDSGFVAHCLSDLNRFLAGDELDLDLRVFLTGEFSQRHLRMFRQKVSGQDVVHILNPFSQMKKGKTDLPPCTRGSWFVEVLGLMHRRVS